MNYPKIDGHDLSAPAPGRLLPPGAFTSPAVYDAEMQRIFARSWVHVADLPELRAARRLRHRDDRHDADRHRPRARRRAARLPERLPASRRDRRRGQRQLRAAACAVPYHAWSYGTDGRLDRRPAARGVRGCDSRHDGPDAGSASPRSDRWYSDASTPRRPPFEEWAGELPRGAWRARGAPRWSSPSSTPTTSTSTGRCTSRTGSRATTSRSFTTC